VGGGGRRRVCSSHRESQGESQDPLCKSGYPRVTAGTCHATLGVGEKAQQQRQQYSNRKGRQTYSSYNEEEFSDFFSSMFGRGFRAQSGGQRARFKGRDYNAELQLNLTDILKSHKQTITVNNKKIRITIPAGVESGQVIKIKGHGEQVGEGGVNGDLYIKFVIVNNTPFKRDGSNLHLDLDLDLYKAVLGGDLIVNTIDEKKVKLRIKPETQNKTKVKLKGKGLPRYKKDGQFGDLYITYYIKTLTNLSQQEKDLFKELSKLR